MGFLDKFRSKETTNPSAPTYLEHRLNSWMNSTERREMIESRDYYSGKQAILDRKRTVINDKGVEQEVNNLPNTKLVLNFYRHLVDQKTNYALGKPLNVVTENEEYGDLVGKIFNKAMMMKMRDLCQEAVIGGIAFLYPYYDERGNFQVKVFDSYEFMPIWADSEHDDLIGGVRVYPVEIFENGKVIEITRAESYTLNGIDRYIYKGGKLIPDDTLPHEDYLKFGEKGYNWENFPVIPFRYNMDEIPLLRSVKELQDALNVAASNMVNELEENPGNSIVLLKNYDGEDLGSFRQNLMTFRAVKVRTVDGVQGGVDILKTETDPTLYEATIKQLRRGLIENGRGFDAKDEKMEGDLNMLNINSAYVDIDADVDALETEFQCGFEKLKFFIDQWLIHTEKGDFTEEELEFVFNRNIFINQSQRINDCNLSATLLSKKTVLANHPFVKNVERELRQLEEDKAAEMEEMEETFKIQSQAANVGGGNE